LLSRLLVWRALQLASLILCFLIAGWLLHGGLHALIAGRAVGSLGAIMVAGAAALLWLLRSMLEACAWLLLPLPIASVALIALRVRSRRTRSYVRMHVIPYRTDQASLQQLTAMFEALYALLARHRMRRLLYGQPSVALEVHGGAECAGRSAVWLGVCCPRAQESAIAAALREAYPNSTLAPVAPQINPAASLVRLRKRGSFIERCLLLDRERLEREPPIDGLLRILCSCGGQVLVQLALTPAPALLAGYAMHLFRARERGARRAEQRAGVGRTPSLVDRRLLEGSLGVVHSGLFFCDIRVLAPSAPLARRVASYLCAQHGEGLLVECLRAPSPLGRAALLRRIERGEGKPLRSIHTGVFGASELPALWHMPAPTFTAAPFERSALPIAPAPPGVHRPEAGPGLLRDAFGPVSIHPESRRQNLAVPGAVEQGKTSLLVASIAEDLRRERCCVILFDPKGDAADAAISLVPEQRTCTLLDFAHPTCGFNPLAASAPADVVADYVVGALRNLFTDADIRASSDRYLRNAIIAVLAAEKRASLWDAARLLTVGEEGYAYRERVGAAVRTLPAFKEIAEFFASELVAQLRDARAPTTAKLDAPVNKLARLLNSPSIKRVLLNESLQIDFEQVIAGCEVLIVKGALGAMGAGNTAVLMQMLMGMLDAALARQQDYVRAQERVAVALKIDEAPLVINRGFAETIALKRSAGLETVACWQTDSQWTERSVRDQLDALFANRAYFATASVADARASASLLMAEYSDSVRPQTAELQALARPDLRLHLPRHFAILSFTSPQGRLAPFIAQTNPLHVDRALISFHLARQEARGGRFLAQLRQAHWEQRSLAGGSLTRARQKAEQPRPAPPLALARRRGEPPRSYAELCDLDRAVRVRMLAAPTAPALHEPDALDLAILELVGRVRYVLGSDLHRRFGAGRSLTSTQRRLKRLADAGLLARMQFHRSDGAGVPLCYALAARGLELLERRLAVKLEITAPIDERAFEASDGAAQIRHELHISSCLLAYERALAIGPLELRGSEQSAIVPRLAGGGEHPGRILCAGDLRLAGGRVIHDLLRTTADGERRAAERFQTIRPDGVIELPSRCDLLIERDDRLPGAGRAGAGARAKLERYEHFLAGWSALTFRYGERGGVTPIVLFICRDRERAQECARRADSMLRAAHAYPGEHPSEWPYPARERVLFCAERDIHEGNLVGYGLPALPPSVRAGKAERTAGEERRAEPRMLPGAR
jgi:hypothetical protein